MRYFILFLLMPTVASASNCCFVCRTAVAPRQITIIKPVQTITRQVSLEPAKRQEVDVEGILAKARALEMAWFAISTRDLQRPTWKTHRFVNHMGAYHKTKVQLRAIRVQAARGHVSGVVNTSFRILPDGSIDFNTTKEQQAAQQQQQYNYSY